MTKTEFFRGSYSWFYRNYSLSVFSKESYRTGDRDRELERDEINDIDNAWWKFWLPANSKLGNNTIWSESNC